MSDDFGADFDCGNDDCSSACDIDIDNDCDCDHHSHEDSWEDMSDLIDFASDQAEREERAEARAAKHSRKLQKLPKSDVRRIRLWAFILRRKNIKVGYQTSDLLDKDVNIVYTLLYNQAFKHINMIPEKTIGPNSTEVVGSVTRIEMGNCFIFGKKDKFPYDIDVTIYYRAKKEFQMPFSSKAVRKRYFQEITDQLEALGFNNITLIPKKILFPAC